MGLPRDYFLLGLNLVLFWLAAWLTYDLGRRLFEPRVGWLASLALLLSVSIWQETVAVNGTPLLMVLGAAGAFACGTGSKSAAEDSRRGRGADRLARWRWARCAGCCF